MRKPLFLCLALTSFFAAHAQTCPITSGATQSTIASVITGCASGSTVTWAAGTYNMNATVSVPAGVSMTGPVVSLNKVTMQDGYVHMAYTPTATINWTGSAGGTALNFGSSTTATAVSFLGCNMNHPSPDGGNCISSNRSNITFTGIYLYGNQANTSGTQTNNDSLLYLSGGTNVNVLSSIFGASGDCSNVMQSLSYAGWSGNGGYCNGVAEGGTLSGLTVNYNIFMFNENESKFYEGSGGCVNCVWNSTEYSASLPTSTAIVAFTKNQTA